MTQLNLKISIDFQRRPKISKEVPYNSEVLQKMIMLYTDLQKSEISKKVLSFTHFSGAFCFLHWFELTYFLKVCQLGL